MTHQPNSLRQSNGFALIDLIFVCGIIGLLCSIALPRLLLAKQAASSSSAIASMRAINSAQLTFALTCGGGFYAPNLTTQGTPPVGSREAFISGGLGDSDAVTKSGYVIKVEGAAYAGAPASCNGLGPGETAQGFKAAADSIEPGNLRFFGTNADALIFEHNASLMASLSENGEPPIGVPLK